MLARFADFMERESGHVLGSIFVMLLCAALWKLGVPKMEDGIVGALAWLGRSMGSGTK